MAKATNDGTCQICERRQKLPSGFMAKHGYTVEHGYFDGVCPGAGQLPYEQSCEMIPPVIQMLEGQAAAAREQAIGLRVPTTGAKGWLQIYDGYLHGYVWVEATVVQAVIKRADATLVNGWNIEIPERGRNAAATYPSTRYGLYGGTEAEIATKMNVKRAESLDRRAVAIDSTIARLQERVDDWKPRELLPAA
jgi:hypothetical protein